MDKIIDATKLQRKFRSVFDEVVHKHVPYILTRGNRPEAVLIPYDQYVRLMRADEAGVLKRFDALLERMARVNAGYSEDEVEADLREATKIVRSRNYGYQQPDPERTQVEPRTNRVSRDP